MKYIHIDSLLEIVKCEDDNLLESYVKLSDASYNFNKDKGFSKSELLDFAYLMSQIVEGLNIYQKNGFFIGFVVSSGMREEFDVLRFSRKTILNIEIKSQLPKGGSNSIRYQLKRHKFLLGILDKNITTMSYIKNINKLYILNKDDELEEIEIADLIKYIDPDYLSKNELVGINLSQMIISPYSQPKEFAAHQYYLTDEQMKIRNEILKSSYSKIGILGGAGTGKSLLLVDLAKKYKKQGKKTIIVFGSLMEMSEANNISKEIGIQILPIKHLDFSYLREFDIILIDEAQRLWEDNFNKLIKIEDKLIIFSADQQQTLHRAEQEVNVENKLVNNPTVMVAKLKDKVRTDPALSSFIKKFLDLKAKGVQPFIYDKVGVIYFKNEETAISFIESMIEKEGYTSIEQTEYITKSTHNLKRKKYYENSKTTHSVLGREFKNVIIVLDEYISYNDEGKITSTYGYYPYIESKMIFQGMTRVKEKLLIVVINNTNLYNKIQEILNWKVTTDNFGEN